MKTLTFTVTADDIREGRMKSSLYCPMARALTRQVEDGLMASVAGDYFLLYPKKPVFPDFVEKVSTIEVPPTGSGTMSKDASEWVLSFDQNEVVEPGTFEAYLDDHLVPRWDARDAANSETVDK